MKSFLEQGTTSKYLHKIFNFFEFGLSCEKFTLFFRAKSHIVRKTAPTIIHGVIEKKPYYSIISRCVKNSSIKLLYILILSLYVQSITALENQNINSKIHEYKNEHLKKTLNTNRHYAHQVNISHHLHSKDISTSPIFNVAIFLFLHLRKKNSTHYENFRIARKGITPSHRTYEIQKKELLNEIAPYLAHELSQPISSILLESNFIKSKLDASPTENNEISNAAKSIISSAKMAANIISNFRSILSPSNHTETEIDLNHIVTSAYEIILPMARESSVRFEFTNSPGKLYISGDLTLLLQVLVNIYKNSIEACYESEIKTVHVRTYSKNDQPSIEIKDSGVGFKNPQIAGQKFFTTKKNGLGLGLSLSHSIIKFHNGEINYQHPKEGGSIVTIKFKKCI